MLEAIDTGSGAWIALLGWPAIAAAVAVLILATVGKSRKLAALGCLLALPMFLYLALIPHFRWAAGGAFALLAIFAWRLEKAHPLALLLLALPGASLIAWLGWTVVTR